MKITRVGAGTLCLYASVFGFCAETIIATSHEEISDCLRGGSHPALCNQLGQTMIIPPHVENPTSSGTISTTI